VLGAVAILGVIAWLIGAYELRRAARIEAERSSRDAEHAAR